MQLSFKTMNNGHLSLDAMVATSQVISMPATTIIECHISTTKSLPFKLNKNGHPSPDAMENTFHQILTHVITITTWLTDTIKLLSTLSRQETMPDLFNSMKSTDQSSSAKTQFTEIQSPVIMMILLITVPSQRMKTVSPQQKNN